MCDTQRFIKELNELIDQIPTDPDFEPVFVSLPDQICVRKNQKNQFFEILKPKIFNIALPLNPKFVVTADTLLKQIADEFLDLIYPPNTLIDFYILEVVQTLLKEIFLSTFSDKRATQYLKDMEVEVVTEKK